MIIDFGRALGAISSDQLQQALGRFGLGCFVDATPIEAGVFGQNLFVTSTEGQFVLRGRPHNSVQFPKERFFARLIHQRTGVPVPWPYLLDPSSEVFGWSYVLMPKMPGLNVRQPGIREALSTSDWKQIARAAALTLAELHTITHPFTGTYDHVTDSIVSLDEPYAPWVIRQVKRDAEASASNSNDTTAEDLQWIESVIEAARDSLETLFTPTLVMRDFKLENLNFTRHHDNWEVAGVFDLGGARIGDHEADLVRILWADFGLEPEPTSEFLVTYRQLHEFRPGFERRLPFYVMMDLLHVWSFIQRREKASPYGVPHFRDHFAIGPADTWKLRCGGHPLRKGDFYDNASAEDFRDHASRSPAPCRGLGWGLA